MLKHTMLPGGRVLGRVTKEKLLKITLAQKSLYSKIDEYTTAESRQSARLFLQSSELGPSTPSPVG